MGHITRLDPEVQSRVVAVGRHARNLALAYALIVFVGRLAGWGPIIRGFGGTGVRPTSHSSATAFLLLALGAVLVCRAGVHYGENPTRRWGLGATALSAGLGIAIVAAHLTGFDVVTWGPIPTESLERPALQAAFDLLVLALAVYLTTSRWESGVAAAQLLSLGIFSTSLIVLLGYVLGDPSVGAFPMGHPLSIPGAITALLISAGVFLTRPGSGVLSLVASPGPGGRRLRGSGLVALLLPAVLVAVADAVPDTSRIGVLATVTVILGLLFLVALYWGFQTLDEMAVEAADAAAAAARAELGLDQEAPLVARLRDALHVVQIESDDRWEVATRYRPAEGVLAGDTSGLRRYPDGSVGAVLVDVVGHGVLPALRAVRIRDSLMQSLAMGGGPAEALATARWLTPGDTLASALVAVVDAGGDTVRYASAGHPPAVLTTVQAAHLLESTGPILFEAGGPTAWVESSLPFTPGDTLVMFSDGVADVQKERGGLPEPHRLAEILLAEGGDAERTAQLTLGFGEPSPKDDQTVIVVRRLLPSGDRGGGELDADGVEAVVRGGDGEEGRPSQGASHLPL